MAGTCFAGRCAQCRTRSAGFDATSKGFSKKDDKANKIIWIVAGSVGLVIVLVLVYVFLNINK